MTHVNGRDERTENIPNLVGAFLGQIRESFVGGDWDGLRASQLRVISRVPDEGLTVTALAELVGMTKQGCGQFVGQLVETGHLLVETDPADRRIRRVSRTPAGDRIAARHGAHFAELESRWASVVGTRRYTTFRRVLEELAEPVW